MLVAAATEGANQSMSREDTNSKKVLPTPKSTQGVEAAADGTGRLSARAADREAPLNAKEKKLLVECETDIGNNIQGFFVVGHRLWQIREFRLYRDTHPQFAAYCHEEWDCSKTHANRMINGHLCAENLKQVGREEVYVPTKESLVRCIAGLDAQKQVQVAREVRLAVGNRRASAGDFLAAKEKLFPKPKREAKATTSRGETTVPNPLPANVTVELNVDTKLVPLAELKTRADDIYNVLVETSASREVLKQIRQLQHDLHLWATWHAESLKPESERAANALKRGQAGDEEHVRRTAQDDERPVVATVDAPVPPAKMPKAERGQAVITESTDTADAKEAEVHNRKKAAFAGKTPAKTAKIQARRKTRPTTVRDHLSKLLDGLASVAEETGKSLENWPKKNYVSTRYQAMKREFPSLVAVKEQLAQLIVSFGLPNEKNHAGELPFSRRILLTGYRSTRLWSIRGIILEIAMFIQKSAPETAQYLKTMCKELERICFARAV